MSQTLVEGLREAYDEFNATKRVRAEALAPDVVLILPTDVLGEGVHHGRDAYVRSVRELTDTFDDFRMEPERFFDLGGDRVLVLLHFRGRAHASGVPLDQPVAHVWTIRENQVARQQVYADWDEALAAVGLPE